MDGTFTFNKWKNQNFLLERNNKIETNNESIEQEKKREKKKGGSVMRTEPRLRSRLPEAWWAASSAETYPGPAAALEASWRRSYWTRLPRLADFRINLTPKSMIPSSSASPPQAPEQVRELWPLWPHCEQQRDIGAPGEDDGNYEKTERKRSRW